MSDLLVEYVIGWRRWRMEAPVPDRGFFELSRPGVALKHGQPVPESLRPPELPVVGQDDRLKRAKKWGLAVGVAPSHNYHWHATPTWIVKNREANQ